MIQFHQCRTLLQEETNKRTKLACREVWRYAVFCDIVDTSLYRKEMRITVPPVNILIKPASSACNMACTYCFYKDVAEHREQAFEGMLTLDQMERVISAGMEYAEHICSFAFQGGSRLWQGWSLPRCGRTAEEVSAAGCEIHNAIQTNGYLIDEEWANSGRKPLSGGSLVGRPGRPA